MGRPSSFTQEQADAICERLANGESLRKICEDESMPSKTTVMRWLADEKNSSFRDQYARAREEQADHYAAEIIEIADTYVVAEKRTTKANGDIEVVTGDAVERARLKVDARKWYASKLAPKKYGDKLELAGDKDRPLTLEIVRFSDATPQKLSENTGKHGAPQ
jgi:hypothetical protein